MQPSQIFVSTRSRREYPRRRALAPIAPVSMLVALTILAWALVAVLVLWWGGAL